MEACWECGEVGEVHHHHPVPKSRGGTRTIPLCLSCHGKAHEVRMSTSALVREALQKAKDRGVVLGAPPYGTSSEEAATIELMLAMRSRGETFRAIIAELNRRGIKPQKRGNWQPITVKRIIDREMFSLQR